MIVRAAKEEGFRKKPLPWIIEKYMISKCRKKSTCRKNKTRRMYEQIEKTKRKLLKKAILSGQPGRH